MIACVRTKRCSSALVATHGRAPSPSVPIQVEPQTRIVSVAALGSHGIRPTERYSRWTLRADAPRMLPMPPRTNRPPLPCPTVRLDAPLRARAQRFAARLAAARGRREGAARAGLSTGGLEFDHYRPYRPGDDLRTLDWDVFARSDQAVVRVLRPEAGERWAILLDTSASMGVGPPGKLQRAAECALALAHLGLREEAELELVDLGTRERLQIARKTRGGELARWLEGRSARGALEPTRLAAELSAARRAERAFLLSDLVDAGAAIAAEIGRAHV